MLLYCSRCSFAGDRRARAVQALDVLQRLEGPDPAHCRKHPGRIEHLPDFPHTTGNLTPGIPSICAAPCLQARIHADPFHLVKQGSAQDESWHGAPEIPFLPCLPGVSLFKQGILGSCAALPHHARTHAEPFFTQKDRLGQILARRCRAVRETGSPLARGTYHPLFYTGCLPRVLPQLILFSLAMSVSSLRDK